nr:hypothetical protein [Allomuricauda sp.]
MSIYKSIQLVIVLILLSGMNLGCTPRKKAPIDLFPKSVNVAKDSSATTEITLNWGFASRNNPIYEFDIAVDIDGRPVNTGRVKIEAKNDPASCSGNGNCSTKSCPQIKITYNIFGEEEQWEWDGTCTSFSDIAGDPNLNDECYCSYASRSSCKYIISVPEPSGEVVTITIDPKNEVQEIVEDNNSIEVQL